MKNIFTQVVIVRSIINTKLGIGIRTPDSENAIVKSVTNIYRPSTIRITGKSRTGNENAIDYVARFKVNEILKRIYLDSI